MRFHRTFVFLLLIDLAVAKYSAQLNVTTMHLLRKESQTVSLTVYSTEELNGFIYYKSKNLSIKRTLNGTYVHNGSVLEYTIYGSTLGREIVLFILTHEDGYSVISPLTVIVGLSKVLPAAASIMGWLYFFCLSASYYPQIFENRRRKSVIGLHLDYVVFSYMGAMMYLIYNSGLYWIDSVQIEYAEQNPNGFIPILLNDVVYSFHALFANTIIALQYISYEKGNQSLSNTAKIIVVSVLSYVCQMLYSAIMGTASLLKFLYICSYMKLLMSTIKYFPQIYLNYKRKSIEGWSLQKNILEIVGGTLSVVQIILNAKNYNDWKSVVHAPAKLILGTLAIGMITTFFIFLTYFFGCSSGSSIIFNVSDLTLSINQTQGVSLTVQTPDVESGFLYYYYDLVTILDLKNGSLVKNGTTLEFTIVGSNLGHDSIEFSILKSPKERVSDYLYVTIQISQKLLDVSEFIGWMYFTAWSVSFYPQICGNWKRKSVVGLNFDYIVLSLLGFVPYAIFNAGLYWSYDVQNQYAVLHRDGVNPVLACDVVFTFHAVFAIVITIIQCIIYDRGGQTVSVVAKFIASSCIAFLLLSLVFVHTGALTWLDFLYRCASIKLFTTFIKYIPQAWMNYERKSTIGWSIGNVLLDFTGGVLTILQMIINAWNYADWGSLFGDFTKFGLGLFSIFFDVLFMIQHYYLYPHNYSAIPEETSNSEELPSGTTSLSEMNYAQDYSSTNPETTTASLDSI